MADESRRPRSSTPFGTASSTAWDDEKPHAALLDHALRAQALPELAGRYRVACLTIPSAAPLAKKKLDLIVLTATQSLLAMKTPPPREGAAPRSR